MSAPEKSTVRVITDALGLGKATEALVGCTCLILVVILLGDCAGCLDTAEIIRAVRGMP